MKNIILIFLVLFWSKVEAQKVIEYNHSNEVEFKVYQENENIFKKITDESTFKLTSPEATARGYFFATSNEILESLYFDKKLFRPKKDSHFRKIVETPEEDSYVQLLHKTTYNFQGNDMCYIMFIAKVKGIDFPFPTLLDLIKVGDNWLIQKKANQKKIRDCLMLFKPCVLSNLIEGNSLDNDVNYLLNKVNPKGEGLDFTKLYEELASIQKNEKLASKLTLSENLDCSTIGYKETVTGKNNVTSLFRNINISQIKKRDELLISQIKKNNDSIVLTSKLEFEYSNKKYKVVKYNIIQTSGEVIKEITRLDQNDSPEKPVKDLLFLFENLNTKIFRDLSPSMNTRPITKTNLYKESRGVYEILNITKLYNLFISRNELFANYIYK